MKIKIGIISDLHCRDRNDGTRTTYLYSDLLKDPISQHPVESLKNLIFLENLSCDYLLCLGDITDKINQQGIVSGYNYLQEIGTVLSINQNNIIAVPGNHDVDSRHLHNHPSFNYIIKSFNNQIPIRNIDLCGNFWDKCYFIREFENLILLAYNSVYNHTDELRAKQTDINNIVLEALSADLKEFSTIKKPRIAICHHHPIKFSNYELEYKDGDSIENGDHFLDLLSDHFFSIIIHGHKHIPHLEYRNDLPVFCSGSFSSLENTALLGKKNTFHIIELHLEGNIKCRGLIDTYEFVFGRGWKKSTDSEGFFPANTGFGFLVNLNDLSEGIAKWFAEKNSEIIRYNAILEVFPDMLFLSPFQQDQLEANLENEYKIKITPSLRTMPEFITKSLSP